MASVLKVEINSHGGKFEPIFIRVRSEKTVIDEDFVTSEAPYGAPLPQGSFYIEVPQEVLSAEGKPYKYAGDEVQETPGRTKVVLHYISVIIKNQGTVRTNPATIQ